ncbi:helix-turn-helix transcriptional regulator, partial [bacterium]|nr:helix-turn-helix transcriptional regulator [bacterium]
METKHGIEIVDMTQEFEKKFAEVKTRDTYHIETAKLEFADEIYDRMEQQGLNQSQLAEKLGLSKQYVSKL